ncbi:MAG: hypothetical protein MI810_14910 [Flavobacteriales bacterium]|nr:hypothetical protein [Flavobacteriales bacterium]
MMILKPHFFKLLPLLFVSLFFISCKGLKYNSVYKGYSVEGVHSRGLWAKDSTIVVSGARGHYSVYNLKGEQLMLDSMAQIVDFRDVAMFEDGSIALVDGSNNSSFVYVNPDGKKKQVYKRSATFVDGFDFWDDKNGIAYGDPFNSRFYILTTENGGSKWRYKSRAKIDLPEKEEAGFAASGTGIQCTGDSAAVFGTGGCTTPRIFITYNRGDSWEGKSTPMTGGKTSGIYSLYFWSETEGVIIGGDYLQPEKNDSICFYTSDAGDNWTNISDGLGGYCSTIQGRSDGQLLVASGRVGTYYSLDKGKKWKLLSEDKYYSCQITDTHIVFSGKNGVLEIIEYQL